MTPPVLMRRGPPVVTCFLMWSVPGPTPKPPLKSVAARSKMRLAFRALTSHTLHALLVSSMLVSDEWSVIDLPGSLAITVDPLTK